MLLKITLVSGPAKLRQWVLQPRLSARGVAAQSTFCELSQLGYLLWYWPYRILQSSLHTSVVLGQTYTHLNLNRIHSSGLVEHKLLKHPNLTRDPFLTSILYHSHLSHFLKVNSIVEFHEILDKLINQFVQQEHFGISSFRLTKLECII